MIKKSCDLLPMLLVLVFLPFISICYADEQGGIVASPAYSVSSPDSPFTTATENPVYEKIEEHPISESGTLLESEPLRVQFVPFQLPLVPPQSLPVLKVKPKKISTGNACKDESNEQLQICYAKTLDHSQRQLCNDQFVRSLRDCFSRKK